ncbi:MAG: 50S ribosomal protein L25 [Chlamydiota bacterium]
MKLTLSKRAGDKKSELTQILHRGDIPAIIYGVKEPGKKVCVNGVDFNTALRQLKKGYLPTTIFELDYEGKPRKAIVKGIQYHPTTYRVVHLDFYPLVDDVPVDVKVPVACLGEADCIGIKLGGFLRYLKRHIKVRCFPSDIPTDFKIDICNMEIGHTKKISDMQLGEGVRPFSKPNEIVLTIAKR